jgi:Flp pilus assembly protein TadG
MKTFTIPTVTPNRANPCGRAGRLGSRAGGSTIELALLLPVLIVLVFGALQAGMVVDRYITVLQLVRTAGMMQARGVDLSQTANKQLLLLAATGMSMTTTGGSGVVYVSEVEKAPSGTPNAGSLVITERFVIGNAALGASRLGTPSPTIWPDPTKPSPNGFVENYNSAPSAVATNMPAVYSSLATNQSVIVAEVYHQPSNLVTSMSYFFVNKMYNRAFF